MNELVLVDVFTVAMEKLIALDLPISRRRKKLRTEREQRLKKRLLEEIKSSQHATGRNTQVETAFAGLRSRKRSTNN